MDERRGGWGQLLACVPADPSGGIADWVTGPRWKIVQIPTAFRLLEGPRERAAGSWMQECFPSRTGTILRILHGLMTIEGRGLSGEKIRERLFLSLALDVEIDRVGLRDREWASLPCVPTERMIALA